LGFSILDLDDPSSKIQNRKSKIGIMGGMRSVPPNAWLLVGAVLGALAVACGAFGAHGLKSAFQSPAIQRELGEQEIAAKLANWETASRYAMYHALALLAVGFLSVRNPTRTVHLAGFAFTAGTIIFSGCLDVLVLTGQRWLGAVVPIGGVLLIVGWILLAIVVARESSPPTALPR
jgi:uncharacterized membrane protein YgdD (TMEM256/DUF423 family)